MIARGWYQAGNTAGSPWVTVYVRGRSLRLPPWKRVRHGSLRWGLSGRFGARIWYLLWSAAGGRVS